MDVFQEASDVLHAWKRDSYQLFLDEIPLGLGLQDEDFTETTAFWNPTEDKGLLDGESKDVDWEVPCRGVGQTERPGSLDRIPSADWTDGSNWDHESTLSFEKSPRLEVTAPPCTEPPSQEAPSRWRLLASYTERGQLPAPQLLTLEREPEEKPYNPAQYAESVCSTSSQSSHERKTLASVARQTSVLPEQKRRPRDVAAYDPRPVMEVRHQMVADKRKKRTLQKADILAQGRAALAEVRGRTPPPKAKQVRSLPISPPVKADKKDGRLIAYQKRKLAVQAEQQRLEEEVQQLRQQVREDAERHRKVRQERLHGNENAALSCLEQEKPLPGAAGRQIVKGDRPQEDGRLSRGALTERKNSNWNEGYGPERPSSAYVSRERRQGAVKAGREEHGAADGNSLITTGSFPTSKEGKLSGEDGASGRLRSKSPHARGVGVEKRPLCKLRDTGAHQGDGACSPACETADCNAARSVQVGDTRGRVDGFLHESTAEHDVEAAQLFDEVFADSAKCQREGEAVGPITETNKAPQDGSSLPRCGGAIRHDSKEARDREGEAANPVVDSNKENLLEGAAVCNVAEAAREYTHEESPREVRTQLSASAPSKLESKAQSLRLVEKARLQAELMAQKRAALEDEAAAALAARQRQQAELVREQEVETMLELLASTKERRALQQAWSPWRATAVRARAPFQRAMLTLQWRRMTLLWRAWREDVQRAKDERFKERLGAELRADAAKQECALDHWRLRLLSQSFVLWQDFSNKERLRKEVQAQHAARSHKMKALLSKQEALRLSLLWKDKKYRAGEVDGRLRQEDDRGMEPGIVDGEAESLLERSLDRNAEQPALGKEEDFPVQIAIVESLLGHVTLGKTEPVGDSRAAGEGPRGTFQNRPKMEDEDRRLSEDASPLEPAYVGVGTGSFDPQASAKKSVLENSGPPMPNAQQDSLHKQVDANSRPVQTAFLIERRTFGIANDMQIDSESSGSQVSNRTEGKGGQRRGRYEDGVLLATESRNNMEERAAGRRVRREELTRKYEEAQKRKQEEQDAAERLRLEAERLEKAAALARRAEEAHAKKQAEQAAARQRELARQQRELARVHFMRQVVLRFGWRPWRSLLEQGRCRLLTSELHHSRSLHRATWVAWRSFVEDVQEERARREGKQLARAKEHHEKRACARAWRWWCQLQKARSLRNRGRMRRVMLCLQEAASAAREQGKAALEARAHLLVTRAWRGWEARVEEGRDLRLLKEVADCAKADRFANRSLLKRSLEQWIDGVELFREEAEKARNEEAMWAKINGWLTDHRKGKSISIMREGIVEDQSMSSYA